MQRASGVAGRPGSRRGSSHPSVLLLVPVATVSLLGFLAGQAQAQSVFPPLNVVETGAGDRLFSASERQGPGFIDERGVETPDLSRRKTILLSALVPGLGQLLRGERTYGTLFMVGEVTSWTSFAVFRVQGKQREDRYVDFAERFAGVEDAGGQSDAYYGYLARYDRSGEPGGPESYNEVEVRAVARDELYPGDRAAQEEYIREHSITGAQAWDWESDARRREYAAIRVASETAYHRSEYSVGGMVAGRILSVMHAIWLTAEDDPETDEQPSEQSYRLFFDDHPLGESRLGVRYRF